MRRFTCLVALLPVAACVIGDGGNGGNAGDKGSAGAGGTAAGSGGSPSTGGAGGMMSGSGGSSSAVGTGGMTQAGEGAAGTDSADAGEPLLPPPLCPPERDGDGVCDEPVDCPYGTDSDCVCGSTNDGECDETTGLCAPGTDYPDCDCPTGVEEPNETESDATKLGAITDCDSDGATQSGTIQDTRDVDVYTFTGDDTFGCVVDPSARADDTSGIALCMYADCGPGGMTVTCIAGDASTSDEGREGCCATNGLVTVSLDCSGTSDSADIYLVVSAGSAGVCTPYSVSYSY